MSASLTSAPHKAVILPRLVLLSGLWGTAGQLDENRGKFRLGSDGCWDAGEVPPAVPQRRADERAERLMKWVTPTQPIPGYSGCHWGTGTCGCRSSSSSLLTTVPSYARRTEVSEDITKRCNTERQGRRKHCHPSY